MAVVVLAIGHPVGADRRSVEKAVKQYEAEHPGVFTVGGDIKGPKLVHNIEPDWQSLPRGRRIQRGPIMVEAVITREGTVFEPAVISKPQPYLDRVVLSALRRWKYQPARKSGAPVPVFLVITVMF